MPTSTVSESDLANFRGRVSAAERGNATREELTALAAEYSELISKMEMYREAGYDLTEADQKLYNEYHAILAILRDTDPEYQAVADSANEAAEATENLSYAEQRGFQTADELKNAYSALSDVLDDYNSYGNLTQSTIDAMNTAIPGLVDNLYDESGAMTDAGRSAISAAGSVQELAMALAQLGVSTAKQNLMSFVSETTALERMTTKAAQKKNLQEALAEANAIMASVQTWDFTKLENSSGGGGGGGSKKDQKLEQHEKTISLLKSELAIMQERGEEEGAQIEKMKQIQDALHREADYLRSIGGDQEEINGLSLEWLQYQNKINDLLDDIGEKLKNDIKETLEDMEERETSALQQQLDAMESKNKAEERATKLKEKQLAVSEALAALENARNERTVRQYNASTGQWEWVANESNVKSAESAYDKAVDDLSEYMKELEKAELEEQIKAVGEKYTALENAIDDLVAALRDGSMDIDEVMRQIHEHYGDLDEQIIISLMKANSANWLSADPETKTALHDMNEALGKLIGAEYNASNGKWYKDGNVLYTMDENGGSDPFGIGGGGSGGGGRTVKVQSNGNAQAGLSSGTIVETANGNYQIVDAGTPGAAYNPDSGYWSVKVYDSGGILHGLGGIKATGGDEMVLPPDITGRMLTPRMTGTARDRMEELRWIYGGGAKPKSVAGTSIGSQHNGNIYNMNGYTITEEKARTTTVYDFARMSRSLKIYNSTN